MEKEQNQNLDNHPSEEKDEETTSIPQESPNLHQSYTTTDSKLFAKFANISKEIRNFFLFNKIFIAIFADFHENFSDFHRF